jgi:hypothetical protein
MRLFLAVITLVVWTIPASAQWLDRATPGIPRTPDGKPNLAAPPPRAANGKIDFSGIWNGPVPDTDRDPANAQPWSTSWSLSVCGSTTGRVPSYQCQPSGPEADRFAGWKRIIQTPTLIAILNDDLTSRVIFMDGRELEANPAPSWMGYSVGHWEGDALIVDSNGYNDKTWLSRYGQSHTEALRVRERWRRADFGHLAGGGDLHRSGRLQPSRGALRQVWRWPPIRKCSNRSANGAANTGPAHTPMPRTVAPPSRRCAGAVRRCLSRDVYDKQAHHRSVAFRRPIDGQNHRRRRIDGGDMRPLVPLSQTLFEGLGIGYRFIVDDKGVATDLVEIHNSGEQRFPKDK